MIEDGVQFPDNILRAQRERFGLYLRMCISYPSLEPSDGDGIRDCDILRVHGMLRDEIPFNDDEILNRSKFQEITSIVGESLRCRIVGYDTQETVQLQPGRAQRLVPVPQHFWKEGRDFLRNQLLQLKGDLAGNETVIICDAYGLDMYQRLLIDIRGACHRNSLEEEHESTIGRFEFAKRFLENGVAHLTQESFTNQTLIDAFNSARENRRGAFGDPEERVFTHPSIYRRKRRKMYEKFKKNKRPRYSE